MNQISIRRASIAMKNGLLLFSHAPARTMKSKNLTYYPYNDIDEQYVVHYIDESGEGEPVELWHRGKCLATAVLAYNDYCVEG